MVHDWVSLSFMVHLFGKYIVHVQMWHFPMAEHKTFPGTVVGCEMGERYTCVIFTWNYLERLWCIYEWACVLISKAGRHDVFRGISAWLRFYKNPWFVLLARWFCCKNLKSGCVLGLFKTSRWCLIFPMGQKVRVFLCIFQFFVAPEANPSCWLVEMSAFTTFYNILRPIRTGW